MSNLLQFSFSFQDLKPPFFFQQGHYGPEGKVTIFSFDLFSFFLFSLSPPPFFFAFFSCFFIFEFLPKFLIPIFIIFKFIFFCSFFPFFFIKFFICQKVRLPFFSFFFFSFSLFPFPPPPFFLLYGPEGKVTIFPL